MANRYWVGGSGTWDNSSTANWSASRGGAPGASAPTAVDNITFDTTSSPGTSYTVTMSGALAFGYLFVSQPTGGGGNTVTFTGSATITCGSYFNIGDGSSSPGIVWNNSGTVTMTLADFNNATLRGDVVLNCSFIINAPGETLALASDLNLGTGGRSITLTAGTLNLTDKTVTAATFSSSNTNTRGLTFGTTGKISLNGSSATIWSCATLTGMTVSGTPIVECTYSGSTGTRTISHGTTAGGSAANSIGVNFSAGSDLISLLATSWTRDLQFTGYTGTFANTSRTIYGGIKVSGGSSAMTFTAGTNVMTLSPPSGTTAVLDTNGKTMDFPLTITAASATVQLASNYASGTGRTLTLNSGTLDLNGCVLSGAVFSSSNSNVRTLAFGSGGAIAVASTGTVWSCATITNMTVTGTPICRFTTNTATARTFTHGSTAGASAATSVGLELAAGTDAFVITAGSAVRDLKFTGYTGTVPNAARTIYGGITVSGGSSAMTFTAGSSALTFANTAALGMVYLDTNGKTMDFPIVFNGVGGSWQLSSNYTTGSTRAITLTNGTLGLNSFVMTGGSFSSDNSNTRMLEGGSFGEGRLDLLGTGTIWSCATLTGFTITDYPVCRFVTNTATARTFSHGSTAGGSEAKAVSLELLAGTDTFVITSGSYLKDLRFIGYTGTVANTARTLYGGLTISGGSSAMTLTAGTNAITFAGTTGTSDINTNSKSLDFPLTFNGTGKTWQLTSALVVASTRTTTLTSGTLNLNGYNLTSGLFSSMSGTGRAIGWGSNKLILTGNAGTVIGIDAVASLTFTGTPRADLTYSGATGTRTIWLAGDSTNAHTVAIYVTAGTDIFDTSLNCNAHLDFTGFAGTLPNITRNLYGHLALSTGMTLTAGTNVTTFGRAPGTQNITSNGKTIDFPVTLDAVSGNFVLQDALTVGSTRTLTLTNGALDLNNFTLTAGIFSSSNSNARVLTFGTTGKIVVTGNGAVVWSTSTGTNLTSSGNKRVEFTYSGSTSTRNISIGATGWNESNVVDFYVTAGTDTIGLTNSVVRELNLTGFAGSFNWQGTCTTYGGVIVPSGVTYTNIPTGITFAATSGTKTINFNGASIDCPITFNGAGGTWQLAGSLTVGSTRTVTLTAGTLDLNFWTLSTGLFSSSNSNTRTLAFAASGRIVLTGNAATIWTTSTTTGLTVTGNKQVEATYSGSTGTRTIVPGSPSEANSLNFEVQAGSDILTVSSGNVRNLILTGFTGSLTSTTKTLYGGLTLGTGMTVTVGTGSWTFAATSGTHTIDTNGVTIDGPSVTFDGSGGTWQLADNFLIGSTRTVVLTRGTLNLNGFTMTTGLFASSNSNARTLAFGAGKIVVTSNAGSIFDTSTVTNLTVTGTPLVESNYSGSTGTRSILFGALSEANSISLSVTAGSDLINLAGSSIRNLNFTGFTGEKSNAIITIYGNLTFSSGMTCGVGAGTTTFAATSGVKTITWAGQTLDAPVTFNGVGGNWQLQDDITVGSTRTTTLTAGTVYLETHTLTTGLFASSNNNTRELNFGSGSKISITGNNATVWDTSSSNGLSLGGTSNVEFTYAGSTGRRTIYGSGAEEDCVSIKVNAGSDEVHLEYGLNDIDLTGFTGELVYLEKVYGSFTFPSAATWSAGAVGGANPYFKATSGVKTLDFGGAVIDCQLNFDGDGGSWQLASNLTLASDLQVELLGGTLDLNNFVLSTGSFYSSASNTRSIAFGSTGKVILTGSNQNLWYVSSSAQLSFTGTPRVEANYSGSIGTRKFRHAHSGADETNTIDLYITAGTDEIDFETDGSAVFRNVDMTGFAGTADYTVGIGLFGNLTIPSGVSMAATTTYLELTGTSGVQVIDCAITFGGGIYMYPDGADARLARNLTIAPGEGSYFWLESGTLDLDGHTLTVDFFQTYNYEAVRTLDFGSGGRLELGGAAADDKAFYSDPGNLTTTGTGVISLNSASAKEFEGGGNSYPVLENSGAGALTITDAGNSFADIANTVEPAIFVLPSGETTTVTDFSISGTSGNLVVLESSTAGVQAILSKSSGSISVSYVNIKDIDAAGGATWIASTDDGNVDSGNNTGWNFASTGGAVFGLDALTFARNF